MKESSGTQSRERRGGTLGHRLNAARRRFFVGREPEKALFREALEADEPPFVLLHLYGPGGVGKSALLGELAAVAEELGARPVLVDARDVEPSPEAFLRAVGSAAGALPDEDPVECLAREDRLVLLVDTYEAVYGLDGWFRERFAPMLPAETLIVTAGRKGLAQGWRTEPGWAGMARAVALGNLETEDSLRFLAKRGTEGDLASDVIEFTRGHPLALSLVADVLDSGGWRKGAADGAPAEVVKMLLEQFVEQVPSENHRVALEAVAHLRYTTEASLAEILGEDPTEVFEWLRELSFVESGPRGVFPHDLAREVLDRDLAWRNPERYAKLHISVREGILRRLWEGSSPDVLQMCYDMIFLHRNSPVMAPFFAWDELEAVYGEPARTSDHEAILELIEEYEGPDSSAIAERWLRYQPTAFTVLRRSGSDMVGVLGLVRIRQDDRSPAGWDIAASRGLAHTDNFGPMRGTEAASMLRFIVVRDAYHQASPGMNIVQARALMDWLTAPGLAWSFICLSTPELWRPQMHYIDFHEAPEAGFEVGGRQYHMFGHDWRARPMRDWLDIMAARELARGAELDAIRAEHPEPVRRFDEEEFRAAVRMALKGFARAGALDRSPLLRANIVTGHAGKGGVEALREVLREAAGQLKGHPRDARLHGVLERTYFEPAETQERAAEELDLPFSTYRRYLGTAVDRVVDWLWAREGSGQT